MPTYQKTRASFKLTLMLLISATTLFCFLPAISCAEDNIPDRAAAAVEWQHASETRTAPCKGLKPFNNLDELLYQFYINLESDCLFEMPMEELEKIWGIKILDEERFKPQNYYPLSETEFYYKPYKSEKDVFYVQLTGRKENSSLIAHDRGAIKFSIHTTKEYSEKHGAFFSEEELPKLLPKPNAIFDNEIHPPCFYSRLSEFGPNNQKNREPRSEMVCNNNEIGHCYYRTSKSEIELCKSFGWISSDKIRSIKFFNDEEIVILRHFPPNEKNASGHEEGPDNSRREALPAGGGGRKCALQRLKTF